jgi:hypothetical protein
MASKKSLHRSSFTRVTLLTIGFVLALCSVGCAGGNGSVPAGVGATNQQPTNSVPTDSGSSGATSSAPHSPTELPECPALFTPVGIALLEADRLVSTPVEPGPGGLADFERIPAGFRTIAIANDSVTCSFILPASERGMVISVVRVSAADRLNIVTALTAGPYDPIVSSSLDSAAEGFGQTVLGDYPYTEAHVLAEDLWVSCFDYYGQAAATYAVDATAGALS